MKNDAIETLRLAMIIAASLGHAACSAEPPGNNASSATQRAPNGKDHLVQVRIRAGDKLLPARLEDSRAARDFAALLPLELTLKDYGSTEKIADLPRKLSIDGAPEGHDPSIGDLTYYAPWGNLAIFHRDFGYSRGLVRLGRIEADAETLGSLEGPVTIEAVQ